MQISRDSSILPFSLRSDTLVISVTLQLTAQGNVPPFLPTLRYPYSESTPFLAEPWSSMLVSMTKEREVMRRVSRQEMLVVVLLVGSLESVLSKLE